ncbi:hypothetical protein P4O66_001849 [Electrophorus voltai]|uniref:Uncharacterized protein n=1 Tax=Electrophorus voltai TaxID=2609070 RepID=A0AAD8Z418_9TELE|nr:hypothetical protein P4O66_001849 [Electrophorus voltai]
MRTETKVLAMTQTTPTSAFVNRTLRNIDELKSIEFGHEYPRHGLFLLHWLADHISVTPSEDILLRFDPVRQDYGFRRYKNVRDGRDMQRVLPHLDASSNQVYYTLGSLSLGSVRTQLPTYMTQDFYNAAENPYRDLDRIVIQVDRASPVMADKVYITQVENGNDFDPDKTYEISPKLLRQVKALQEPLDLIQPLELHMSGSPNSTGTNSDDPRLALAPDQFLAHLKNTDKRLKTIFEEQSVRWLLSLAGYDIDARYAVHKKTWSCSIDEAVKENLVPETLCEGYSTVKIEVKSTPRGYARLTWRGIPRNIMQLEPTLVLFTSDTSEALETFLPLKDEASGSENTFVALKHGLHPRLISYGFSTGHVFFSIRYSVIWRGPQFDGANRVIPIEIRGYNASLQLYTREGYACARLYIRKLFIDWQDTFRNSWVGFYTSKQDQDNEYKHYQWVSGFEQASDDDDVNEYLVYEYQSSMSIGPGLPLNAVLLVLPVCGEGWVRGSDTKEVTPVQFISTYGRTCDGTCETRGESYSWCYTTTGWDYCSQMKNVD